MSRPALVALAIALLAAGAAGFLYMKQQQPTPTCTIASAPPWLGHGKAELAVSVEVPSGALEKVTATLVQGDRRQDLNLAPVASPEGAAPSGPGPSRFVAELDAKAFSLVEGPAEIVVSATDDAWRPKPLVGAPVTQALRVDLTPPTLKLVTFTTYVKHAGAVCVTFRASDASKSGVEAGGAFFPGTAGLSSDPKLQVALATIPYSMPQGVPMLVAEDEAGNRRQLSIPVTFLPTDFGTDVVTLSEDFIRRKVPEVDPQTPGDASAADLLARYLKLNGSGRAENEATLRSGATTSSAPRPLWTGAFKQQSNSKVFAGFPQRRTYTWEGRQVDEQWHLGLDLGSNKRSPVEASNAGQVIFTGPVGIYGNTVILDHGLGLASLYAHLSEIGVTNGQTVAQGESIGRTGETGFAGGDHLHFAMFVHGVYVNPIEWWDASWIRDRFGKPLADAGISLPGVTDLAAAPVKVTKPAKAGKAKKAAKPARGGKKRR